VTQWPFLDHGAPLAFAHRGGALDAPENSLEAFCAAADLGFVYLETDVQVTADGEIVAFHDDRLDRVTDGTGRISELPLAEVRQARIDGTAAIPLLAELLETLPEARVNIDPKTDGAVEPLAEVINAMGVVDRVCVGSFSGRRISRAAKLVGPRLCRAMMPAAIGAIRLGWGRAGSGACIQVPARFGFIDVVTPSFLDRAHRAQKVVHVWTVDEADEMNRLLDLGVDGLMTDRPGVLRSVLQERGQWVE
jgi:glycerophosphoryl diester phosphodiesterase